MSDPWTIDPRTGKYRIDYSRMTEAELMRLIQSSSDDVAKAREILATLVPAAAAQALLNRGAVGIYELVIRLAKRSPEKLLELIV